MTALASICDWNKDYARVESLLKRSIELNPRAEYGYFKLGLLYTRRGDFSRAEPLFLKAIEIAPNNKHMLTDLGGRYRLHGDMVKAEALFLKALRLNPQNDRALEALVSLYEDLGKNKLAYEYRERLGALRSEDFTPVTIHNYHYLKSLLDQRGIRLICVQYPMRSVEPLRRIFEKDPDVIFVDNESVFRAAVKKDGYAEYFKDMFAGDFGHCTSKGNELLAQNIADVILGKIISVNRSVPQSQS